MKYKYLDREGTVLLFDKPDTIKPTASLQVMRVGDRGMIHSLMGAGFYQLLDEVGLAPFMENGIRYIYAAITDTHLILMRSKLKLVDIERQGECDIEGHAFNWVLITPRAAPCPL